MGNVMVAIFQGKGCGNTADYVIFKSFNSVQEANDFVANATNLERKYWTFAKIVHEGEREMVYSND